MHAELRLREIDPRGHSDADVAPAGIPGHGHGWRLMRGLECGPMDGAGCDQTPADGPPAIQEIVAPGTAEVTADATAELAAAEDVCRANRARIAGELYVAHYHQVYAFVRRFLDEAEAEEVAHESFVRLLKVRELERMSISVAYLFRIAENLLRRRYERAQRYRAILERLGRVAPWAFEDSDAVSGQIVAVAAWRSRPTGPARGVLRRRSGT